MWFRSSPYIDIELCANFGIGTPDAKRTARTPPAPSCLHASVLRQSARAVLVFLAQVVMRWVAVSRVVQSLLAVRLAAGRLACLRCVDEEDADRFQAAGPRLMTSGEVRRPIAAPPRPPTRAPVPAEPASEPRAAPVPAPRRPPDRPRSPGEVPQPASSSALTDNADRIPTVFITIIPIQYL